jgi:16S rRNA (uracil1498-N3)-methyltransferase
MGDHRRFFVRPEQISGDTATLTGDLAHQIGRVMRLREGDKLRLLDGLGAEYEASITGFSKSEVTARIVGSGRCLGEPQTSLTLALCLLKGDKVELVVQKCSELGISQLAVVRSERSVARPDSSRIDAKLERWRRIAAEAAEQSGRGIAPGVRWFEDFAEMAPLIEEHALSLIAWEGETGKSIRQELRESRGAGSALVVIGPEGGLTEREVNLAKSCGARCVSLGRRVLRAETAAIAACAAIMYELEGEL